jgi:hypothetical protein
MWGWLKKVANHGVPIAVQLIPGSFRPVADVVYNGVRNAEMAGGTGPEKLSCAMRYITLMIPAISLLLRRITGREVVNEQALVRALKHLAEFFVLIEKCVGVKPS